MNNRNSFLNPSHSNNMINSLVSKFSSLNLHSFKNVTSFNNYVNTSSHFWLNAFTPCSPNNEQNTSLNTDNSIIHEEKIPKSKFPKKFTISTQQHTNQFQSAYTKEWTKEEIKILIQQYYTLHNRNWDNISSIITTKSPQQCCYKIKSIELKSNNKHFTKEDDICLVLKNGMKIIPISTGMNGIGKRRKYDWSFKIFWYYILYLGSLFLRKLSLIKDWFFLRT